MGEIPQRPEGERLFQGEVVCVVCVCASAHACIFYAFQKEKKKAFELMKVLQVG